MILILNGPNLNLLGKRQPEIYGSSPFDLCLNRLREIFPDSDIEYLQSNHEGVIIDAIQKYGFDPQCRGIILNAGGYTHSSVAIADAVAAVPVPVAEVHISNIYAREGFRHNSLIAPVAAVHISGAGLTGYELALRYLLEKSSL